MATKCVVCGRIVDFTYVKEEFDYIFAQVDKFGIESLPKSTKLVYEGKCCSVNCYIKLD